MPIENLHPLPDIVSACRALWCATHEICLDPSPIEIRLGAWNDADRIIRNLAQQSFIARTLTTDPRGGWFELHGIKFTYPAI